MITHVAFSHLHSPQGPPGANAGDLSEEQPAGDHFPRSSTLEPLLTNTKGYSSRASFKGFTSFLRLTPVISPATCLRHHSTYNTIAQQCGQCQYAPSHVLVYKYDYSQQEKRSSELPSGPEGRVSPGEVLASLVLSYHPIGIFFQMTLQSNSLVRLIMPTQSPKSIPRESGLCRTVYRI